jgi:hypothetical protein
MINFSFQAPGPTVIERRDIILVNGEMCRVLIVSEDDDGFAHYTCRVVGKHIKEKPVERFEGITIDELLHEPLL